MDGSKIMRDIDRPTPGDVTENRRRGSKVSPELAKRKSAYYMAEFANTAKEPEKPTEEKVRNESFVMAELKTNVIIEDEFRFITDLSYHLSNRYQRPMSSVIVHLQHGCCMMFGGSFDPAYTLTIHAIPSLVGSTMNKRNAVLIQHHMEETLRVRSARGWVRFVATGEDTIANGGKTLAGELGIEGADESSTSDRRLSRALKVKSIRNSLMPGKSGAPPLPPIELARLPTPPESMDDSHNHNMGAIAEHPPSPEEVPLNPFEDEDRKNNRRSFVTSLFKQNNQSTKQLRPKTSSGALGA